MSRSTGSWFYLPIESVERVVCFKEHIPHLRVQVRESEEMREHYNFRNHFLIRPRTLSSSLFAPYNCLWRVSKLTSLIETPVVPVYGIGPLISFSRRGAEHDYPTRPTSLELLGPEVLRSLRRKG